MPYITNTDQEREGILASIHAQKFEELVANIHKKGLYLPQDSGVLQKKSLSEMEVMEHLTDLSRKNVTTKDYPSFLGAGAYHHFIPAAVGALISRGEFLTAYTPYQPEASQGTLQATFEFQSMIASLYGMDLANASLYDGASALAEAALVAVRETNRPKILVAKSVHPEYRKTLKTVCSGFTVLELDYDSKGVCSQFKLDESVACLIIQSPNYFGNLEDGELLSEKLHKNGSLLILSANPLSLGILEAPGAYGADIAVGEGQPLGLSLNYGGPYLGLFACKNKYMRKVPGRIVGLTKDLEGKRGYVLTLQTREQHIRREKATSNICTNQALMALAATVYLSLLGPRGLRESAELNLRNARYAAELIANIPGFTLAFSSPFFNEFVVRSQRDPQSLNLALLQKHRIIGGKPLGADYPELKDCTLYCVTEMNSKKEIDALAQALQQEGA